MAMKESDRVMNGAVDIPSCINKMNEQMPSSGRSMEMAQSSWPELHSK
jgi:hypothetical protein